MRVPAACAATRCVERIEFNNHRMDLQSVFTTRNDKRRLDALPSRRCQGFEREASMKNTDELELSEKLGETARRVRLAVLALDGLESRDDAPPISDLLLKVEREIKDVANRINPPISPEAG